MARARRTIARSVESLRSWPMGCGVDVVELERFKTATARWGKAFLNRVFTPTERAYARSHRRSGMVHLAARFAAKEAVVKAMAQVDPAHPLTLQQIEIRNDSLGRPYVVLHDGPANRPVVHVSLSHAEHVAMAMAVVQS